MLQENQNALEKYRPDFKKVIEEYWEGGMESGEDIITLDTARDGNSVLTIERNGQVHRLNSAFRPVQEADRWAAQYQFDHLENIVVLFGLGNGIFLKSLEKRLGKKDKIIVYEPSFQVFQTVLENVDISDIISDARVRLLVDQINAADFYFLLEYYLDWRNIEALCICEHPAYRELYIEKCTAFYKQIAESKELIQVVKHTDVHFAHQTVMNYFMNMRYIAGANIISDFVGKIPKDFPAIIVSAGPSLSKNIEMLKQAEGKAFILAVDSAVNALLNHGVKFDAMITVDAGKSRSKISREECFDIPLFCGLMSRPEMLQVHRGKKIWIMGARYIDTLYAEMNHPFQGINIGGCVATAAFAVCEKMGFEKIVLIGQDLAYDGEITHVDGEIKNIVSEEVGQEEIDGWAGAKVRSRYDWIIYRNWFESMIQQLPEIEVINATEGGALIHGSKQMKLSEVIEKYCLQEFSVKDLLIEQEPTFTEEEYVLVKEKILHLEKELETVRRNARDAVILCDEVINLIKQRGADVPVNKQAKRLSVINDVIVSQGVYQLLDYYITDSAVDDLKEINQMTGKKDLDLINTYLSAKAMYESLIQAVENLNGKGLNEEIDKLEECCESTISICKDILEKMEKNTDLPNDGVEKLIPIAETLENLAIHQIAWYFLQEKLQSVLVKTNDTNHDNFVNSIKSCELLLEMAEILRRDGFVGNCMKNIEE